MATSHARRNRRSGSSKTRRRVIGASSSIGAFLAAAMTPLAPPARADVIDVIIDPLISAGQQALTGLTDLAPGIDPGGGWDLTGIAAGDGVGGFGLSAGASAEPLAALGPEPSVAGLYDTLFYQPVHTVDQAWINSAFGTAVDNSLNDFFREIGGQGILIGNGDPGTALDPNGGAGGLVVR